MPFSGCGRIERHDRTVPQPSRDRVPQALAAPLAALTSATIAWMTSRVRAREPSFGVRMSTDPESLSTVTVAPMAAWMARTTLPWGPISAPIFSLGITRRAMRGANGDRAPRGPLLLLSISPRMCFRPTRARSSATRMISNVMPSTLMSIWKAVTPTCANMRAAGVGNPLLGPTQR